MINKNKSIAAVVVTYNRKKLLVECIRALLNQTHPIDAVYIIDNASTDGTYEYLIENRFIDSTLNTSNEAAERVFGISLPQFPDRTVTVHYVRMHENTGGAGGFCEGIKRVYEANYDWLWLMDDDAEPKNNALELLVNSPYFSKNETGALLCSIRNIRNDFGVGQKDTASVIRCEKVFRGRKLTEADFENPFLKVSTYPLLGILVKREVITEVGNVNKEFFIFSDDLDFTLRISDSFDMWIVRNSIIMHKAAAALFKARKFFWRNIRFRPIQNHWREYYGYRNYIYIVLQRVSWTTTLLVLIEYTKIMGKYLLLGNHKFLRMSLYIRALKDAFNGTLGKTIDPKQFYAQTLKKQK